MTSEKPTPEAAYQERVHDWMMACFGAEIAADPVERSFRFLEESLELVQANGCTKEEALRLVEYVYGRPVGEVAQEVGGVSVCLAALCTAAGVQMSVAAEAELARVWTLVEKIRAKHASKPAGIRSSLPGVSSPSVQAEEEGGSAGGDGWLEIASAPRDGTAILAASVNHSACEVVCWQDGVPSGTAFLQENPDEPEEGWVNTGMFKDRFYANPRWFTHWRPLPAPPSSNPQQDEGGKP